MVIFVERRKIKDYEITEGTPPYKNDLNNTGNAFPFSTGFLKEG